MKYLFASIALSFFAYKVVLAQPDEKGSYYQVVKHLTRKDLLTDGLEEIKLCNLKNGMRVMDVGGLDGKLITPISLVCDTVDYYLEDIRSDYFFYAPKFMALVKKRVNPKANFGLHQILGTDSTIPAQSHFFNCILVHETFHHFTYPMQMLATFRRLLAPNGSLVISEPASQEKFKGCKLIPPQQLIDMVKSAGFSYGSSTTTKSGFIVYLFCY